MTMIMTLPDWLIVIAVLLITMGLGFIGVGAAGKSKADYFVGGRAMPWWLLGFSMVATTFSTDAPNLVTNLVRECGVCGNWQWWAMLPSGMLTAFLFAKLWRRSGIITDVEYYELRYSGRTAAFLRGFRAVYLGFFFNVFVMGSVTLAAIKIGGTMLNLTPMQSVLGAMVVTTIFSTASGLRGVLFSDMFLFIVSMVGAVAAAFFAVTRPDVGGLSAMLAKLSATPELLAKTEVFGFASASDMMVLFIVPLTVIWWSVWYPGAEPGGGGFLVQRMLAAKDERHAAGATLFFNIAHYALRPWPWLLVALCSLIVYPDRAALIQALSGVLPESQIQSDAAYSLMLRDLPVCWKGITVASLLAAYVSTMSTLLNWGSSYLINDFYGRFIRPEAGEKEQVTMGRIATVLLMVISGVLSLVMESAMSNFNIILSIGAGTGLLFMVRWFWWRINAAAEITAMIASFLFSVYFNMVHPKFFPMLPLNESEKMIFGIVLTTLCWLAACYLGPRTSKERLYSFCRLINPAGPGWNRVRREAQLEGVDISSDALPQIPILAGVAASIFGCLAVFGILYATGELLYFRWWRGILALVLTIPAGCLMWYFGVTLARRKCR